MARKLVVEIIGDSSSLEKAFARSGKSAARFNRELTSGATRTRAVFTNMAGMVGPILATLGAAGVVVGLKNAVDAASDLNEQLSRSNVLFGASAKEIDDWSKTTATSFGVSQREALATAGAFGSMLETAGRTQGQAALMSRILVQLAADMASFNNQDPSEMLVRLQSGLAGEAEPLRRFGVFISDAAVKAEAYRDKIAKSGTELNEQQKVVARYNLILRQTGTQQGDFARTSDGLANLFRILKAELDNVATSLGQVLIPYLKAGVGWLVAWLGNTKNQARLLTAFQNVVLAVADSVYYLTTTFGPLIKSAAHAAGSVIQSWEKVKRFFELFWVSLQVGGLKAFRKIVEPFSHLPTSAKLFGQELLGSGIRHAAEWAQETKAEINRQIPMLEAEGDKLAQAAVPSTKMATDAWNKRLREWMKGLKLPKARSLAEIQKMYQQSLQLGPIGGPADPNVAKKAAEAAKKRRQAAQRLLEEQQHHRATLARLAVGWAEFARRRVEATKTFRDDVKTDRAVIAALRREVKVTGMTLELAEQIFDARARLAEDLKKQREQERGLNQMRLLPVWSILSSAGADLTASQRRRLTRALSGVAAGGVARTFAAPGLALPTGGGMTVHGGIHLHGVQNVPQLENELAKRHKARPHRRRGS